MTDICMDVDTALSEVPVNVMPLIDDTDFKTIEDSLAYNASGMDLNWNFVTSAGAFSQTNVTPTTGGDYDWSSQGNGLYTIEIPASGGASINNDTEGYGWFSGFITGVLPWRGPIITFRAAALNDALIDGGDTLDVNVTAVSGDTTAADNIEADYDGTGYAKTNSTIGTATDVTNQVTANVTAISGDSTAADNLEADYDGTGYTANKVGLITRGTAQAGASSSITLASGYSATADDDLVGAEILLTGGTGADQSNIITAWNNTTKVATVVRAWATTPSSGTTYDVMGFGGVTLTSADVGDAVWDEALSGHTTAGTAGKAVSDIETDAAAILVDTGTTIPGTISTIDSNVDAILVDTGTTLPATLGTPTDLGGGATLADNNADMAGATFSTSTDSQEAIRNNQAAASDAALLQNTTIATLASQTSFTLTAGSADDDAYNGAIAVITDQSTSTQKAVGTVLDYTGSSKTVTLSADPGVFTMAVGDTIDIIAGLGSVSGTVSADVVSISGDSTAADNLEAMFDGTGYIDDTAPSSRSQIDGISAASGGALNFLNEQDNIDGAVKSVTFVGTETSGTNASVNFEDGTYHQITHDTNAIDIVYQFDIGGGRTASELTWKGYLDGSNDTATIQVYNGSGWDTVGTIQGKAGTTNDVLTIPVFSTHTGTGSDLGKVYVRIAASATSPVLYTDQLYVSAVSIGQTVGYVDGAVWVNTNASNTNTESFVDGTADNPVSTWAAALTIAAAVGLSRFRIVNGSSITLSASAANYELVGEEWTLALGGQSISSTYIYGATVSGTGTGSNYRMIDCKIGTATLADGGFGRCALTDTLTMSAAGTYLLEGCFSGVAGSGTPVVDFGAAVGSSALNMRHYSGGIQIDHKDGAGTDTMSLEGNGQLIVSASSSGAIVVRGNFGVTNTGGATITYDDNTTNTAAILTDTAEIGSAGAGLTAVPWNASWDAEVQSEVTDALNAYDPPTNAELSSAVSGLATAAALATVDSNVDSILDDTGTSGVVVAGTLDVNVAQISGSSTAADNLEESAKGIVSGACEGTPSTTVIQTDLAETTDDHYIGRTIIFTSGDADGEATEITDYTGSTGTVTVTALTTAPSASDTFVIV